MVTTSDWGGLGSAVFTAVAAGAAWWTAWQGRQLIEAAERSMVEAQLLADPSTRMLMVALVNSGPGLARTVNYRIYALGKVTYGTVGDGFMQPADKVHVLTPIGPLPVADTGRVDTSGVAVIVAFRDARGFVHYRTPGGEEWVPRTRLRRPRYPEFDEVWRRVWPAVPVASATLVGSQVQRPSGD